MGDVQGYPALRQEIPSLEEGILEIDTSAPDGQNGHQVHETLPHYWGCTRDFMPARGVIWQEDLPYGREAMSGLPIIGRDTRINGGVWINHGEFLVMDDSDRRDRKVYHDFFDQVDRSLEEASVKKDGHLSIVDALGIVGAHVTSAIPLDINRAERTNNYFNGKPLPLSFFIKGDGGGVCRHQAALGGLTLEHFSLEKRILDLDIHLQRNRKFDSNGPGHAWVRADSKAVAYILDVTQGAVGRLDEMGPDKWPYQEEGVEPDPAGS